MLGSFPLMALGTEALGFGRLFPGIRLSLGKPGQLSVTSRNTLPCQPPPTLCMPRHAGVFDAIMVTPFVRELCLLHGWCGVDRRTLLARLRQGPGSAVGVYVGGAAEAVYAEVGGGGGSVRQPCYCLRMCFTHASQPHAVLPYLVISVQPGTLDLVLLRRKGFIKVALEAGAAPVPVLCFGENEQYHRVFVPRGGLFDRLQALTKRVGMYLRLCLAGADGCSTAELCFLACPNTAPE